MGQNTTKDNGQQEETTFWDACSNGDYETALSILEKNQSLLEKTYHNHYCLHWVVSKGHYGLTRILTERYPQLVNLETPVVLDSTVGKAKPIHIAINRGYADILKLLIDCKADLKCESSGNFSPLGVALSYRQYGCAKILIKRGAPIDYFHTNPSQPNYHLLDSITDSELLQLFLQNGLDPNSINPTGNTLLHTAIINNQIKCAEVLISSGSRIDQPNINGDTPLHLAITHRFTNFVKTLISNRADCNTRNGIGQLPSQLAVTFCFPALNELLEIPYLNITPVGQSAIPFQLVERVNTGTDLTYILDALSKILKSGFPANEFDPLQGMTLLQLASRNNQCPCSIIELLLSYYADPHTTDSQFNTPLHNIVKSSQVQKKEKVIALLESSADPNSQNSDGQTPLHLSTNFSFIEITECLINYGADLLLKDKQGRCPLQIMMMISGFKKMVDTFRETNPEYFENLEILSPQSICPSVGKILCWQCGAQPVPMCYYLNNNDMYREDNFRVLGYSAVCVSHKAYGDSQNWIFVTVQ